ncbi:MAG: acetyl-CoA carboxylase biotin carboxylase subunit [Defluviitaleaceae bacterium]|nr:acetyl-CoA carboxylase biotin carboxylase subunit [Defluviitaleaceae bacterium]
MFSKILIANRGEIAVRVIRACKEMGIATVAVFSDADKDALHVSLADESFCIGKALPKDSYLNMKNIISAALVSKAEAIHPGYGFLAENAEFAKICAENKIVFIGPASETISSMGDKDMARKTMTAAGVPIIPGCELVENAEHAKKEAARIGFPLLIKARAGGGGKGIRLIQNADELENNFFSAVQEAKNFFNDDSVYMEKFLAEVKHIEMQILADNFGNVVCLGERDCSMQRKNQKLIEESPSPFVSDSLRKKMTDMAIAAAKAVDYRGAGTIECLCDKNENFYFMEMNTRLQVEHPVTEMVTGIDLVKWQIRIAAGVALDFSQEEIKFDGHAIECRICAENPYMNFRPSAGKISMLHVPGGPWVRFDSAIYHNYFIPPFYDSMVGKLIVAARTRNEAIRKMKAALCELIIEGVEHNSELQIEILGCEEFDSGAHTTATLARFLEKEIGKRE